MVKFMVRAVVYLADCHLATFYSWRDVFTFFFFFTYFTYECVIIRVDSELIISEHNFRLRYVLRMRFWRTTNGR